MRKSEKLERIEKKFKGCRLGEYSLNVGLVERYCEDNIIRFGTITEEVCSREGEHLDIYTPFQNIMNLIDDSFESVDMDSYTDDFGTIRDELDIPYTHNNLDVILKLFKLPVQAAFELDREEYQKYLKRVEEAKMNEIWRILKKRN